MISIVDIYVTANPSTKKIIQRLRHIVLTMVLNEFRWIAKHIQNVTEFRRKFLPPNIQHKIYCVFAMTMAICHMNCL